MRNVGKYYECCTGHIPEVHAIAIDQGTFPVMPVMLNEHGWLFAIPSDTYKLKEATATCGAFLKIMDLALDADCDYVLFDRDVEPVSYLKLYDW